MLKQALICVTMLMAALPVFAEDPSGPGKVKQYNEDESIALLVPETPWAEKDAATRRLRQIGTAKAVPALAAMLQDPKTSHLARYALEAIPAKEAGAALRDALAQATGGVKTGITISLGVRRDAAAVALITPGLHDPDVAIAAASAGALGRIGTQDAVAALLEAAASPSDLARPALGEGLLAAVEHLTKASLNTDALKIAALLQDPAWPEQVRFGAFRAQLDADRSKAGDRFITALGGADPKLRDYAAHLVATMPRLGSTQALAEAFGGLPAEGQAALLSGLTGRGSAQGRSAALKGLESADARVKAAAIRALGVLGRPEDATVLAGMLGGEDQAVSDAAKTALAAMTALNVDGALAKAYTQAAPGAKAPILAVLAERMAPQTSGLAVAGLKDAAPEVRLGAIEALAKLGAKDEAPALIEFAKATGDAGERGNAANALNAIAGMQKDDVLPAITAAFAGASNEVRGILFGALVRVGNANALQAYLAELQNTPAEGRDEALRLFAGWPARDAAPHLLEIAKNDEAHRADLLRGYVRLATTEPDPAVKAQLLTDAMAVAQRTEEKWIVLPGWGSLATQQSLDFLKPMLDDAAVRNEAGLALIAAASSFGKQGEEAKQAAVVSLQAVVEKADNPAVKERAQKALEAFVPPAPAA